MVPDNGEWIYIPSSPEVQEKRKKDIEEMYDLVMKIKSNDRDFNKIQKVLKGYHDNDMITYEDNPYLNRTGEFDKNQPFDALYRGGHRTAVTATSPNGRGIQYTSLIWEEGAWGNGFMSEQFIRTFLHEPIHHRSMEGGGHTSKYNDLATRKEDEFYKKEDSAVKVFYDAYPKYKSNE
jgi:hypothetical protein